MIQVEEKVMESFNDNLFPFIKTLSIIVVIAFIFEAITGVDETAFKGAGIAFCKIMYVPFIMYKYIKEEADAQKYSVEDAQDKAMQAISKAKQAIEDREQVIAIATALKANTNALQEKANALANECERLRADEQTRLQKIQTLNSQLQTLEAEKQTLSDKLANADKLQANAIANAKKEATNALRAYSDAGTNYLLYAVCKGISNVNSPFDADVKAKAKEQGSSLKSELDAFVDKYKEQAINTLDI